ncbi:MAG: tRNA lysidine(34) synthetase TilS [Halieaceae bacterium]
MSLEPRQVLASLQPWLQAPRWWLGLSGGLDSCVLLHLLGEMRALARLPEIRAVHVDHQLGSESAQWAQHCQAICEEQGIELVCRQVSVTTEGRGLEAAARTARYRVFEDLLGADELLLLAHHRDDQVETFFLRMLRGAGSLGLGGMPLHRRLGHAELMRPLLDWHRSELEDYANQRSLSWVDDPSNQDQSLDRNFLRHSVLPVLEQRWPAYRHSVEGAMAAVAEAEVELHRYELAALQPALGSSFGEPTLDLVALQVDDPVRLCRLLRRWLMLYGLEPPGRRKLEEFARQLGSAAADSQPQLSAGRYQLRRYRQLLYLCSLTEPASLESLQLTSSEGLEVAGLGRLEMRRCERGGLRLPRSAAWQLGFRLGGERCQPVGRRHSQQLKKLLQEYAVPPWWRDRLPLLYADGELAAVADLWVCAGQAAEVDGEGYQLHWSVNSQASLD